ncbi:MAG: hypothetical protein J6Z36_04195 [Clostridia bacterium]|nr:hypothetical protein [Clostridia bacterium]
MFSNLFLLADSVSEVAEEAAEGAVNTAVNMTWILTQYLIFGSIFIVGLIVLIILSNASKKPITETVILKTEEAIKKANEILEVKDKKSASYSIPGKIMQLNNEVGNLVVLADKEVNERRNISYAGVLSAYQTAAKLLLDVNVEWSAEKIEGTVGAVQNSLQQALDIVQQLNGKKK